MGGTNGEGSPEAFWGLNGVGGQDTQLGAASLPRGRKTHTQRQRSRGRASQGEVDTPEQP